MGILRNPLRSPLRSPIYGPLEGKWGGGVIYDPDASALFARFTTPPTDARKTLINNLIVSLKAAGVWAKLDALYVMAAADSQAARRNWVADQYNLTAANSPTFTTDRGYAGNGSSSYLATNFNPSSASSPKYAQNDASMFSWSRTNNQSSAYCDIGANSGAIIASIRPRVAGSALSAATNCAAADINVPIVGTSIGLSEWTRRSAVATEVYRDGISLVAENKNSNGTPNSNISLLANAGSSQFSINQVAGGGFGSQLDGSQSAALYTALNTYLQAVGAA